MTTSPSGRLQLHRAERADALVGGLAGVLATGQPDPLAREVVAVPARGVERWVTQRLSHHLGVSDGAGVCANVDFPSPGRLVADCVAAAGGTQPDEDPWAPRRLIWTLLQLVDDVVPAAPGRRFLVSQHLTKLFTSYGEQRPAMLSDWAAGRDNDGAGDAVAQDLIWQPQLWRRLRAAIGSPSPAERLDDVVSGLRTNPDRVDLPSRVSVFGPTRLTTEQVLVLTALGEHRDVHLWLLHPSAPWWDAVTRGAPNGRTRRRADPTTALVRHRLLASLGRDAREMQLALHGVPATDQHHPHAPPTTTLLGRLQADLRADREPEPTHDLNRYDRSLQVHACHGRSRQVEVLREVLLGLLETDPSLEPRDVLVMCPDIESYAPLISAAFGLADAAGVTQHPGHRLRVRLADRSLRQTNPLLDAVARLLELADARVTASQVLDLLSLPPVRRRFHLDDDDLERLGEWIAESEVRWGMDAAHREPFHLDGVGQNTWLAGLDRLLLGVTMAEDDLRWLGLALPLDDVDSGDVDLTGRFAEHIDRLGAVLDELSGERPLRGWLDTLSYALDSITEVAERDEWQLAQARRELGEVATAARERAETVMLRLADVRALLADLLKGRPTRANFRTGNLTMCSMVPMRSVPHRVICLLGLDDGVFPRSTGVDGDDILPRDPLVGERDRRSEDRQLLLDAVLAAEEHLVVLYTGADERTGAERPPAVPLGEILDVVDATASTDDGRRAREHVVVRHPLQPFDSRNFEPGVLGVRGSFSHDEGALAGAQAAARPRLPEPPLLAAPLAPYVDPDGVVPLDRLVRYLEHPVRGFFTLRLGIGAPAEDEQVADALHAELEPLAKWAVGDRWLQARLAGADADAVKHAEWLRGTLPPGALGQALLSGVIAEGEPLIMAGEPERVGEVESYHVSVPLPDGRVVAGTVGAVHGTTVARTVFSRLGPKHRLRAWVLLLALAASRPGRDWRAVTIGRGRGKGKPPQRSVLVPPDDPASALVALVDLRDAGLREPLPLPLASAHAYAHSRHVGDSEELSRHAAGKGWSDSFDGGKDDWHIRFWGEGAAFDLVTEGTPFPELARDLWWPLLDAESLGPA